MSVRVTERGCGGVDLFQVLFFAAGKVEHFVCAFDEDGALGFGLGNVECRGEDGDLGFGDFFDDALGFATEYHALDDTAAGEISAHDFDDADVVDVEVGGVVGHDGEGGFCDECGQGVFEAVLFGCDGGFECLCERGLRERRREARCG